MNTYKLKSKTFTVACEDLVDYGSCTSPRSAVPVLRSIFAELDASQEHFVAVMLNSKGKVIGHKTLSTGTATACLVTPEMVFRAALVLGGVSVLCCHNHPSGDPTPSREDNALTERLRRGGDILGLPLADHIILGSGSEFRSYRSHEGWDTL